VTEFKSDLYKLCLTGNAVGKHLAVEIPVAVDVAAAAAQTESWLQTLARFERLEPRFEISWRTCQVNPSVSDVLDRQNVVVVSDRLESNNST